jgi:hypothetical protein
LYAADLFRLVGCCPNLCEFKGVHPQHGVQVSALRELTALTHMTVYYGCADDEVFQDSVNGLATMTQLRKLCFTCARDVTAIPSLYPLRALTALTTLYFDGPSVKKTEFTSQVMPSPLLTCRLSLAMVVCAHMCSMNRM